MYPKQHHNLPEHHYPVQRIMDPIYYTKNNPQQTWPNRIAIRPASTDTSSKLTLQNEALSNRAQAAIKPPPYTYAKAFTKMTPNDLMLYESFRNKTLSNGDDTGDHEHVLGHMDDNENGAPRRPINGIDTNLNEEIGPEDVEIDVYDNNSVIEEDMDEDQNHGSSQNFNSRSDTGTSSVTKTVRNGRPWMFGVHKNRKVIQLNVPKESEIGFKITESQDQGIFVEDVVSSSAASRFLKKMDKILDIDGVDFTRISLKEAYTVLSNSGPILNIMISRI